MSAISIEVLGRDGRTIARHTFNKSRITIGSQDGNDVIVIDSHVSREHAHVDVIGGRSRYRDHSTNGSFVNGKRVIERDLETNDEIRIGLHTLRFVFDDIANLRTVVLPYADNEPVVAYPLAQLTEPYPIRAAAQPAAPRHVTPPPATPPPVVKRPATPPPVAQQPATPPPVSAPAASSDRTNAGSWIVVIGFVWLFAAVTNFMTTDERHLPPDQRSKFTSVMFRPGMLILVGLVVSSAIRRRSASPVAAAQPAQSTSHVAAPVQQSLLEKPIGLAKHFDVFVSPTLGMTAIKRGFSWPGFFFTAMWCLVKGLYAYSLLLWLLLIGLRAVAPDVWLIASVAAQLGVGFMGNEWLRRRATRRGFSLAAAVRAVTPAQAVMMYLAQQAAGASPGASHTSSPDTAGRSRVSPVAAAAMVVFMVVVFGVYAYHEPPKWSRYEGDGFSVRLPQPPGKVDRSAAAINSSVTMTKLTSKTRKGTYATVNYFDVPAGSKFDLEKGVDAERDRMRTSLPGGVVTNDRRLSMNGTEAREFTIAGGNTMVAARVFTSGSRVYELVAIGKNKDELSKVSAEFFESFTVTR